MIVGIPRLRTRQWGIPMWSVYCEGEKVGLKADQRGDCLISITRIATDRQVWTYAKKNGWQLVCATYCYQVCPGCVTVLIGTRAAERTTLPDESEVLLLQSDPRGNNESR